MSQDSAPATRAPLGELLAPRPEDRPATVRVAREPASEEPAVRVPASGYARGGKRALDLVLLALLAPIALPVAFAIFLVNLMLFRSPRRAFFVQDRVGQDGRVFRMVKFRTMRVLRDSMGWWSSGRDVLRVTRFGRLLRNTHLDELPQLLNVLRGDMSVIGPRPEMPEIEDWARTHVPGYERWRNPLLPGITGLAQVSQGYVGPDVDGYVEKLEWNERYARDLSLLLDLRIVFATVLWMLCGRGWLRNPPLAATATRAGRIGDALAGLEHALEHDSVAYAVLRGERAFEDVEAEADVDFLVAPKDAARLEALLFQAAHLAGVTIHERWRTGVLRQYYLHAYTPEGRHEFLALDVHTAECVFGVPYATARELLAAGAGGKERRLAPSDSALVDFLGPYLSGGEIREDYARRLAAVADEARERARRVFGRDAADQLLHLLVEQDEDGLRARARSFRRAARLRAFMRRPLGATFATLAFAWSVRVVPLLRPRGRMLAFLGTDGSGKSTLAEAVARRLAGTYRGGDPRLIHLRPKLLPQLDTLVHFGRSTYSLEDMARPHRARPSGALGSNLRVAYYWLDWVLGYLWRVLPLRRRHVLILFDRYFDDYLVDPERSRVRRGTWLARLLVRRVPRPDKVIVCTAPHATVRARKAELSEEECMRQLAAYERLAEEHGHVLVDTGDPIEACVDRVLDALFGGGA